MDAGISSEYFAGGVGLVQRVLNTIAGPRTIQLVSASVGPSELPVTSYGVEVSLDRPVYYNNLMPPVIAPWPIARVRLAVRNETELPVEFTQAQPEGSAVTVGAPFRTTTHFSRVNVIHVAPTRSMLADGLAQYLVWKQWKRWLLVRRSISDPSELTGSIVCARAHTTLAELVRVAGTRWTVEERIECAKGEVGLDHYEVRSLSGWYCWAR